MTAAEGDLMSTARAESERGQAGLWRVRWFRTLTIVNASIVVVSAGVAMMLSSGVNYEVSWWLFVAFPVVGATVLVPWASVCVLGLAAGFSALNTIGGTHKVARFLRTLTVWGTIVLVAPVGFTAFAGLISLLGAIL